MSKHTLLHWKYMHDRARSLCMITSFFPLSPNSPCSSHCLHIFQTSCSPYHRVGQAKCIMGIMPTPKVAFRSKGLGTSSWGSSESGTWMDWVSSNWMETETWPCVTYGMAWGQELPPWKLPSSLFSGWLCGVNERNMLQAHYHDLDFSVTEKYFQMWIFVGTWSARHRTRWRQQGHTFVFASVMCQ